MHEDNLIAIGPKINRITQRSGALMSQVDMGEFIWFGSYTQFRCLTITEKLFSLTLLRTPHSHHYRHNAYCYE